MVFLVFSIIEILFFYFSTQLKAEFFDEMQPKILIVFFTTILGGYTTIIWQKGRNRIYLKCN